MCKSWVRIPGMAEIFSVNIGWKRRRGRYIMDRPGEDPFPQSLALGKSLSPHARLRDFPETLRQRRRNQTAKRRETGRTPAAAHITRLTKDLSRANYKVTSNNRQHTLLLVLYYYNYLQTVSNKHTPTTRIIITLLLSAPLTTTTAHHPHQRQLRQQRGHKIV